MALTKEAIEQLSDAIGTLKEYDHVKEEIARITQNQRLLMVEMNQNVAAIGRLLAPKSTNKTHQKKTIPGFKNIVIDLTRQLIETNNSPISTQTILKAMYEKGLETNKLRVEQNLKGSGFFTKGEEGWEPLESTSVWKSSPEENYNFPTNA